LPWAEILLDRFELSPSLKPVIEPGCHVRLGKRQALLATLRNTRIEPQVHYLIRHVLLHSWSGYPGTLIELVRVAGREGVPISQRVPATLPEEKLLPAVGVLLTRARPD
jgi:hypothetical protein